MTYYIMIASDGRAYKVSKARMILYNFLICKNSIASGLHESYPLCCVLHYAFDIFFFQYPYQLRGLSQRGHVPCVIHKLYQNT